ncbi:protein-glutamate methylesterase/protein-glutamine glutaminase [Asticcacaulis excentricus]|uniref:Protein-glutamate methylesterase/protein-glutamine glutaminase n=1 Tax=Asticcacaulis excentricus TaxID=78587 RepID=A0A3G9G2H7_9CAUL|nr:chemotaxis response regulator protein-glutamate methylesterase [Asticcacaulis excentricus]BBF81510.1 chemotaxis response regulator protein-glutamate methylesterase CheB [Asticcacaulis excentricus]
MSLNPNPSVSLRPLRVMIVDDSAVVRGLVTRWIEAESDMVLVGSATDGQKGIDKLKELQPDVLILDIEMPNMNGLEALPKMLAAKPGLKILMASTLTTRGASVTIRALELGAADYVPKPDSARIGGADGFKSELLTKVRALCGRTRAWPNAAAAGASTTAPSAPVNLNTPTPGIVAPIRRIDRPTGSPAPATPNGHVAAAPRVRTMTGPRRCDILLVGASTGGPPALRNFLAGLGPDWRIPVLIVQHMPSTFTTILAEHLDKALPQKVVEAQDGMGLKGSHIYIAPGDFHMTLKGTPGQPSLRLDQSAPVNWCRPAVDPLFKSGAELYGKNVVAVVLTGMGHDGRDGARALVDVNATVMVQDEKSSVVWGMPGAVAEAGLAEFIKPIDGLAQTCRAIAKGERII